MALEGPVVTHRVISCFYRCLYPGRTFYPARASKALKASKGISKDALPAEPERKG